ncbi:hypothetical protein NQ314_020762 [Rhamnusium bicolor]|uniref:CARP motif domain-containing protein n=1 Tax=Rhamnusium bicolor TaxID=1586634 RepID=A0AAV8WL08_9CUCU|nr:hypothetical protein NQ314_020762 [Rhamnusium bicolor]
MSVLGFTDIVQGALAQYLQFSQKIGGDVAQHSQLVQQAFNVQLQFLQLASQSGKPANQNDLMNLLKPTSDCISAIQNYREKNRTSTYFNHLSAISESIPALGWVAVSPAPAPYVKEMNDAGQFYTNRVLKDWKEKNKTHVDWVKSWIQTLTELQAFVKQYHTTGLVWGGKGAPVAIPPPPPGAPLPPPPLLDFNATPADAGVDRSALFAQLNQGANVTSPLKQGGPTPFKGSSQTSGGPAAGVQVDKPPKFVRDGKKWLIVFGKVPTISIDKTDGCQIYLSQDSLDVEIVSAKSSEMNVLIPKGNGDYTEIPIPEQFKTTILPNKTLSTVVVENKG